MISQISNKKLNNCKKKRNRSKPSKDLIGKLMRKRENKESSVFKFKLKSLKNKNSNNNKISLNQKKRYFRILKLKPQKHKFMSISFKSINRRRY